MHRNFYFALSALIAVQFMVLVTRSIQFVVTRTRIKNGNL